MEKPQILKEVKTAFWFQKLRGLGTLIALGFSNTVLSMYFMDAHPLTVVNMCNSPRHEFSKTIFIPLVFIQDLVFFRFQKCGGSADFNVM